MSAYRHLLCVLLAVATVAATADAAPAGWVTIKNDTKDVVVVQELVTVNGVVRKGKPLKLQPGEVHREFRPGAWAKTLQVCEPGLLANKPVCQATLAAPAGDAAFAVSRDGDKVKLAAAK